MLLRRFFQLSMGVLLFGGMVFGGPISLIGVFGNSFLNPAEGSAASQSLPASSSYRDSAMVGSFRYSVVDSAYEDFGTVDVRASSSYAADPSRTGSYSRYNQATAISGATFLVTEPVYLSESVTLNFSQQTSRFALAIESENLQYVDASGHAVGTGCSFVPAYATSAVGTQSCSTGLVFVSSGSTISISDALNLTLGVYTPGDMASAEGSANLSPLQVYDSSRKLIETLDLNTLTLTPEPSSVFLIAAGLFGIAALKLKLRK